jgi:hypothetical protein
MKGCTLVGTWYILLIIYPKVNAALVVSSLIIVQISELVWCELVSSLESKMSRRVARETDTDLIPRSFLAIDLRHSASGVRWARR